MKKKTVITKENIDEHLNRVRPTKSIRVLTKILRTTESMSEFFNTLHFALQTPQKKNFVVTKFGAKSGKPLTGKYVIDKASTDPIYNLTRELERAKIQSDLMTYLVDNVPKKGIHLIHVTGGAISIEYDNVLVWSDQHSTDYAINLVAKLVKSHSRFD